MLRTKCNTNKGIPLTLPDRDENQINVTVINAISCNDNGNRGNSTTEGSHGFNLAAGSNIILSRHPSTNTYIISSIPIPPDGLKIINISNGKLTGVSYRLEGTLTTDNNCRDITFLAGEGIRIKYNSDYRIVKIEAKNAADIVLPEQLFFNKIQNAVIPNNESTLAWTNNYTINANLHKDIYLVAGRHISITSPTNSRYSNYLKIESTFTLPVTTKGDILTHNGISSTALGIHNSPNNYILRVDKNTSTGLSWVDIESILPDEILPKRYFFNNNLIDILDNVYINSNFITTTNNTTYSDSVFNINLPITQKGDLISAIDSNTITRLPVGVNGSILRANDSKPTGLEWFLDKHYLDINIVNDTNNTYKLEESDGYKRHYFSNSRVITLQSALPIGWQCEITKNSSHPSVLITFAPYNFDNNPVTYIVSGNPDNLILARAYGTIHLTVIALDNQSGAITVHITGDMF